MAFDPASTDKTFSRPIVVGIAGGIASGKSVVAKMLTKLGARLIDGDQFGHQVLGQAEVIQAARDRWGDSVIDRDGNINRMAVAQHVFGGGPDAKTELAYWESCTHPRITELLRQKLKDWTQADWMIEQSRQNGTPDNSCQKRVVALDAPVMFKAGWDKLCDHLIFVDTPRDKRLQWALQRDGWTEKHFEDREASQLNIDEKIRRASFVIDNAGTLDQTYEQVLRFWQGLSSCQEFQSAEKKPQVGERPNTCQ